MTAHEPNRPPTVQRLADGLILAAVLALLTLASALFLRWRPEHMALTGIDTAGHYAWLRSPLLDGDLEFGNDYRGIMDPAVFPMHDRLIAETGRHANPFPIGTALLLLPGFLVAHGLLLGTRLGEIWPADGFSPPYGVSAFWSLWVWAAGGLFLLHAWLRHWWPRGVALAAVIITWCATGAVFYTFPDIVNNHSSELFAMPLFLLAWQRWEERPGLARAVAAGFASGFLFLVRWQLVLWPVVFWAGAAVKARRAAGQVPRPWPTLAAIPIAALVVASPQLLAWRAIYGQWLLVPQGEGYIQWLRPMVLPLLFSPYRGWITWTPLVALGLVGLGVGWRRDRALAARLAAGLALQLWISSIVSDWHGAFGFSARRLTHATPLVAWGVAAVIAVAARGERRRLTLASIVLTPLVAWNALFLVQYHRHLIPYHRALTWHELVGDKLHLAASIARRSSVLNAMAAIDESRAHRRDGRLADASASLDLAARWIRRARLVDPGHEDVYLAAAAVAMERGDTAEALSEYQACLVALGVDRPQILTSMGACALYGGRPDMATAFARAALALRPDFADAQRLLADAADGVRQEQHRLWFF